MPTTLPVRRAISAERQVLADDLAAVGRLIEAARRDGNIGLPRLLRARLDLWLIGFRLHRLRQRHPDQPRSK